MGSNPQKTMANRDFLVKPDPDDPRLSRAVDGIDENGRAITTRVVTEKPLTVYLNRQEIVTMMTIGDYPDLLAVGYLLNQNMLSRDDRLTGIDYDDDLDVVVVRTERETDYEEKLQEEGPHLGLRPGHRLRRPDGRIFRDRARRVGPDQDLLALRADQEAINTAPSLYLTAGAIHGCVLCREDRPLVYMEDVGRHNAVDKIAGWMFTNGVAPDDKIFYTTGRLTSEMVIKSAMMGIPILVSRSGFTAWGVDLARQVGLTLIGRARGKRFVALSGEERIVYDLDPSKVADEDRRHNRKGAAAEQ